LTYTGTGTLSGQLDYYSLAGHLIGSTNGTTTSYDLTDAQGSILATFSASAIQGEQNYGPYGNQRYTQGTIGTDKGYTGQFQDTVSGLDYYNARYYDPVAGVFLAPDSVQGNAQGMNPYSYVGGNPTTMMDPTGHRYIDGQGNYANIDPSGDLALFDRYAALTSTTGYIYQMFFYTAKVARQPISHGDGGHSISQALGIPTIQQIWSNPKLNPLQKIVQTAGVVVNDAGKVATGVNLMLDGPVALPLMMLTNQGGAIAQSSLFMTPQMWRSPRLNNAPTVSPGSRVVRGVHVDDPGNGEPYCAVYDCFGRQVGRTDVDDLNGVHFHAYSYNTPDAISGSQSIHGYP
jgi:RHS repeat-associated protein